MVCRKPFKGFGCGQCLPCRISLRNIKTTRGLLESFLTHDNSFVTLTYCEEALPEGGSLNKKDIQLFMKRLLRRVEPRRIRRFGVAEYGEQTMRPHYHLILFGYPTCLVPPASHQKRGEQCDCPPCKLIHECWKVRRDGRLIPAGFSDVRRVERQCVQYVAGYVTKKMTKKDDPRLGGRVPEFSIYSNRPGIGADAMRFVNESLTTDAGAQSIIADGDVPSVLKQEGKTLPLGRYMKSKLRQFYGFPERRSLRGTKNNTPDGVLLRQSQELCALQECYESDPKNSEKDWHTHSKEVKQQQILNLESKHNTFTKKGEL